MHTRGPAVFVGDSIGLDFLNSITTSTGSTTDWIDSGEGLLSWLEQAQLVPAPALDAFRAQALPGELDTVAGQVRELREWFRGFVQKRKGSPLPAESLDELGLLNRLLARDQAFSRIALRDAGGPAALEFQSLRRWQSPEALYLPVAEALARFVCTEDFSNVKACEGHACTLLFADRTGARARRWCSMAMCGNRAKQAAHRHRLNPHHR
jgi:predicted RNA-binding Zn ribbon-like protein